MCGSRPVFLSENAPRSGAPCRTPASEPVRTRAPGHRAGLDVGLEARSLYGTVSGLVVPLMLGAYSEERAMEVLDAHLDRLFG